MQHNIDAAAPRHDGGAEVLRRAGLSRDRDADAGEVDARRGARLPGAEPRAPGRVLRAAAVAADLQADPDDLRARSLLPDRQVLPRRGPARRPPARVHPGRPRDVVRDRGPGVLDHRAADGAAHGAHRARRAAAVPAHAVRGGDRQVRFGQAGPPVRHGDRAICRRRSPRRRSRSSGRRSRAAARCAGSSCQARRSIRAASWTSSSSRRSSSARPGWCGRGHAEGAVQSSALKAAGEDAIRQRARDRRRRRRPTCC